VWEDVDGFGIQDDGELGVADVFVKLYTVYGGATPEPVLLRTTYTSDDGHFAFVGLPPGNYFLEFDALSNHEFTLTDWGTDDDLDSDVDWQTGRTPTFSLETSQVADHWDAGLVPGGLGGVIGDRVWYDDNGNGIQDEGEPGAEGIEVRLLWEPQLEVLQTTTTDTDGRYGFVGVEPGDSYSLIYVTPGGPSLTLMNAGTNDALDSDPYPPLAETVPVSVAAGERDLTWDAGLLRYDFGDAPAPYPTLAEDNGARHLIVSGFGLGLGADGDPDGQPHPSSWGDDGLDESDDEDGVVPLTALTPGTLAKVQVTATHAGVLDAWIDFGGDGSWAETEDRILSARRLPAGATTVTFPVPETAQLGETYARFRFREYVVGVSQPQAIPFNGLAGTGEVEDYQFVIEALDFGDAPDWPKRSTLLLAENPSDNQQFGSSVAIEDDWAFVSQRRPSGSVSVYHRGADGWWLSQILTPNDSDLVKFGGSVAVSGDWAIIGNFYTAGEVTGVHMFQFDGTEWVQRQRLMPPDDALNTARFGESVAIAGDLAVVGMKAQNVGGWGRAYVYRFDGANWEREALDGGFGEAVAVHGDTIAVGSVGQDLRYNEVRKVSIFEWDGAEWANVQTITASDAEPSFEPRHIAMNDEWLIVGAVNPSVYRREQGQWEEHQVLPCDGWGQAGQEAVSISGSRLVCRVEDHIVNGKNIVGRVFEWNGMTWVHTDDVPGDGTSEGDTSASSASVAISGDRVLIGRPLESVLSSSRAGKAYIHEIAPDTGEDSGVAYDYPTVYFNNGARHSYDPGMYLGEEIDFEPDALVHFLALGDDDTDEDDDDGVVLSRLMPGRTATATVTASASGFLNAWIDFNQDGDWDDEGEQIFTAQELVAGENTLEFTVPEDAVISENILPLQTTHVFAQPTMARFRFSSEPDLPYDGPAPDGEVEDYGVMIVEPDTGEVSGRVLDFLDPSSPFDRSQSGLNLWPVQLVDAGTGAVVAEQRSHSEDTNGDGLFDPQTEMGLYRFTNVPYGDYDVRLVEPELTEILSEPQLTLTESNLERLAATVRFPEPTLEAVEGGGENWTRLTVPGVESMLGEPGMPAIPIYRQLVAIPAGVDPATVTVELVEPPTVAYTLSANLVPFQVSPTDDPEEESVPFSKNEQAYRSQATFPSEIVHFQPLGNYRDLQVGLLEIATAQYSPVLGQLRVFAELQPEITLSGPADESPGFLPVTAFGPFEHALGLYDSMVNRAAVFDEVFGADPVPASCPGEEFLILTHPDFREAADQLAEAKNAGGMMTTVMEVGAGTQSDTQEIIKSLIQYRYDNCRVRPSYVLLLGDVEFVPSFEEVLTEKHVGWTAYRLITTDIPYTFLSGEDDTVLSDVAIGRMPVRTPDEAMGVVRKTIDYQWDPPNDVGFYRTATVAAQFTGDAPNDRFVDGDGRDDRMFVEGSEEVRGTMMRYGKTVERIYTSDDSTAPETLFSGQPLPPDLGPGSGFDWDGGSFEVVRAFNDGRFLITHRDHGSSDGWIHPEFRVEDLVNLNNGERTPVVYSINCSSGMFMEPMNDAGEPVDSFAEALLKHDGGGAVAVVASAGRVTTWSNSAFYRGLIDATWTDHDPSFGEEEPAGRLGDIANYAKAYALAHVGLDFGAPNSEVTQYKAIETTYLFHVFGDPTLAMWTENPHQFTLPSGAVWERHEDNWLTLQYPVEDSTITAYQLDPVGNVIPLGRGTVQRGSAIIDLMLPPEPTLPIQFAASMPGAVSVPLEAEHGFQRPEVVLSHSDIDGVSGAVHFPEPILVPVEAGGQQWTQMLLADATKIMGDCGIIGDCGKPAVPVYRQLVALPKGVDASEIVIDLGQGPQIRETLAGVNLYPVQESPVDPTEPNEPPEDSYGDPPFVYDPATYLSQTPYPAELVRVESLGTKQGLNLAIVEIAAAQYNPAAKELVVFENVPWSISFPAANQAGSAGFLSERDFGPFQRPLTEVVNVLNEDAVLEYVIPARPIDPTCVGVEYLILTHPDFREAADKLADWKNAKGIVSKVHEVGAGTVLETQEEIKDYIQAHYDNCQIPPSYVLLLGDVEYIPTTYAHGSSWHIGRNQDLWAWGNSDWMSLGIYHFDGASDEGVMLTRRGRSAEDPDDLGTMADAIRFTNVETGEVTIVDNDDPGFTTTGSWTESPVVNDYNGSSVITNTEGDSAVWYVTLPAAGRYDVEVWNSNDSATDDDAFDLDYMARYRILGPLLASDTPYAQMDGIGDSLPDLAVGRIPVDMLSEALAVVDKTIAYERTPPRDFDFYSNVSTVGVFQGFRSDDPPGRDQRGFIEESERVRETLLAEGYTVERIYARSGDPAQTPLRYYDGTPLPAELGEGSGFAWDGGRGDFEAALNDGRFLVTYRGHGSQFGLGRPGLSSVVGTARLNPVLYAITCEAGHFDLENAGRSSVEPFGSPYSVFVEKQLRAADIGPVAIVAASRTSPTWANNALLSGLIDATWPDHDPTVGSSTSMNRVGDILLYGKEYMIANVGVAFGKEVGEDAALRNLYIYNVFGDPTLEMWTEVPSQFTLSASVRYEFTSQLPGLPSDEFPVFPIGPTGMELQYAIDGATITATQEIDGEVVPLGRAIVRKGKASMEFIRPAHPDKPVKLVASKPGAVSVPLTKEKPARLISPESAVQRVSVTEEKPIAENVNFGTVAVGSIHGMAFEDVNADGKYDPKTDLPQAGVEIGLYGDADGDGERELIMTLTDENGLYGFTELFPGAYAVAETAPEGWVPTTTPTRRLKLTSGSALVASELVAHGDPGWNASGSPVAHGDPGWGRYLVGKLPLIAVDDLFTFGNAYPGSIYGIAFEDVNADGAFDRHIDMPLPGVRMGLFWDSPDDDTRELVTTITDAQGRFAFTHLVPGPFAVAQLPPAGSMPTTPTSRNVVVYSGHALVAEPDFVPPDPNQQKLVVGQVLMFGNHLEPRFDFGDAPLSGYPTLAENNGAYHAIRGPFLGDWTDAPDPEVDGLPDPNAWGDNNHGSDDENGVTIPVLEQGQQHRIDLEVNGGGGFVDAWIDFNGDGTWQHPEEYVSPNIFFTDGPWGFPVVIPADAVVGRTYARFRISRDGGLLPTGPADNGEVEDHTIEILGNDGVPLETEDRAPHGGDGNQDGVPDRLQHNVASLPIATTGNYVTLVTPAPAEFRQVASVPNPSPEDAPQGMFFAAGFFNFHVVGIAPGSSATVTIYIHEAVPINAFYRYGPTPEEPEPHWYPFLFDGSTGAEIFSDRIVLHFVDGQRGDDDLTADGTIIDVGAPCVNEHPMPWQNPATALDVNDDGVITPLDVLTLIVEVNRRGAGSLPVPPMPPYLPPSYFDINGDNTLSPLDVMYIIQDLNAHGARPVAFASTGDSPPRGSFTFHSHAPGEGEETPNTCDAFLPTWPFGSPHGSQGEPAVLAFATTASVAESKAEKDHTTDRCMVERPRSLVDDIAVESVTGQHEPDDELLAEEAFESLLSDLAQDVAIREACHQTLGKRNR
jgi:protocatechuate 3,4-dioxygenase beta subunit